MKATVNIHGQHHIVRWVGRERLLYITVVTWCGQRVGIDGGVYQVPDHHPVCSRCEQQCRGGA